MTRGSLLAALAAVTAASATLAACSNLPDVAAGACGNGVVESGEDCDGAAATGTCGAAGDANACHFVCTSGAACPSGYACAADQRCRAPSATFVAAPGPYSFDATDLAAGDVDGDGIDDLVGVSAGALTARFGTDTADLFHAASQPIRTPVGHAVFGDLDGDGHLDVVVPSSIGVFSFLASGQGFNPYPYTSITLPDATSAARTAAVEVVPDAFSEMLALLGRSMSFINAQNKYAVCLEAGTPPLCAGGAHTVADLLGDTIPTGRTGYLFGAAKPLAADTTDEVVIAFQGDDHLALWSPTPYATVPGGGADESTLSLARVQTLALPKAGLPATQLVLPDTGTIGFGQFDKDGCVDLLIPTRRKDLGTTFEGLAIAYGTRSITCTGTFDAPVLVAEVKLDAGAGSKGLLPRAVADLDGDGVTDVITNQLIAVTSCTRDNASCAKPNTFTLDFRSFTPREWRGVVATDVNHDGKFDLAGFADGQDDVDVLLGAGLGFFNRFQIATTLPPRAIRTGDFDGDLFLDVAIVTGDTSAGDGEDDHLQVLFGSAAGGPSAPVDMGSFGVVQDVAPVSMFTDLESIDFITDMIVIADRGGNRGVAPLIGSSTRRLLTPYLLGEDAATAEIRDTPVAILMGQFDTSALSDVVALAHQVAQQSPTSGSDVAVDLTPRMFLLSGTGSGNLVGGQPAIPDQMPDFEYRDALWASARLTPSATASTVIGVDATDDRRAQVSAKAPHLFAATPPGGGAAEWTIALTALPAPYNAMRVHALRAADLDGDGDDDLILELTSSALELGLHSKDAALVAWNQNGSLAIASPSVVYPAGTNCRGAAPLQTDPDATRELAAVCTGTGPLASSAAALTLYHYDGTAWSIAHQTAIAATDPQLVAGDFNGDRVDDLAITSGTGASASVQVYTQCAAGDAACAVGIADQTQEP